MDFNQPAVQRWNGLPLVGVKYMAPAPRPMAARHGCAGAGNISAAIFRPVNMRMSRQYRKTRRPVLWSIMP